MRRGLRSALGVVVCGVGVLASATPALACGGLVAPNGSVRLTRATTAVGWHDGVEHYVTAFAYQGAVTDVGWIVPLPAVPDSVGRAGSWTLQRLQLAARPPLLRDDAIAGAAAAPAGSAQVLQKTTIDALDITVLRGSGQAVVDWCAQNGFAISDETRAHIQAYATSSPIFMAARYDVQAALARGQFAGDGTPVLITMHTPRLWVPLEVLSNGSDPVDADVYTLTDARPYAGVGNPLATTDVDLAPGLDIIHQAQLDPDLLTQLRSDRNSDWIRAGSWFTAYHIGASSTQVTYDLTVEGDGRVTLASMGAGPDAVLAAASLPGGEVPPHPTGSEALAAGGARGLRANDSAALALTIALSGVGVLAAGLLGLGLVARRKPAPRVGVQRLCPANGAAILTNHLRQG